MDTACPPYWHVATCRKDHRRGSCREQGYKEGMFLSAPWLTHQAKPTPRSENAKRNDCPAARGGPPADRQAAASDEQKHPFRGTKAPWAMSFMVSPVRRAQKRSLRRPPATMSTQWSRGSGPSAATAGPAPRRWHTARCMGRRAPRWRGGAWLLSCGGRSRARCHRRVTGDRARSRQELGHPWHACGGGVRDGDRGGRGRRAGVRQQAFVGAHLRIHAVPKSAMCRGSIRFCTSPPLTPVRSTGLGARTLAAAR